MFISLRTGPELEVSGYGCEDHFLETDTYYHSWEVLGKLINSPETKDILCDVGAPIVHKNIRYNCRVFFYNSKILLIRPKLFLANDGNYRETRWFSPWTFTRTLEQFPLPRSIRSITSQEFVPFGDGVISSLDTVIGAETCEELFTPASPHIYLGLDGVEIFTNGSGSHHQLRKLNQRVELIRGATSKSGGIYLYANQQGCDGGRLYYDGSSMIAINGSLVAQGSQFSINEVEVVTATVDLDDVRNYRGAIASRSLQAASAERVPRVQLDAALTKKTYSAENVPSATFDPVYLSPAQEIAQGPACWLWDYLRRSGMRGFFLPLSGGADSSATAAIVGSMTQLIYNQLSSPTVDSYDRDAVLSDLRRVTRCPDFNPKSPQDIASKLFYTCYMASDNSSVETRDRAAKLASQIGSLHYNLNIESVNQAFIQGFTSVCATGLTPKFKVHGGSETENLALQNIQARSRMVYAYLFAQLLPWSQEEGANPWAGSLLVLGSANVDEALRGYMTKYDCSSADINPIGGISKTDLKMFLKWASVQLSYPELANVVAAPPTAELEPITNDYTQTDEDDMGMTYDELSIFGRLRKQEQAGPVSMFEKLVHKWSHLPPSKVSEKVKHFFKYYSINRHKATVVTPSYHAESYSPDDNRFDLRQFLYNVKWPWQFSAIDKIVDDIEAGTAEASRQAEEIERVKQQKSN